MALGDAHKDLLHRRRRRRRRDAAVLGRGRSGLEAGARRRSGRSTWSGRRRSTACWVNKVPEPVDRQAAGRTSTCFAGLSARRRSWPTGATLPGLGARCRWERAARTPRAGELVRVRPRRGAGVHGSTRSASTRSTHTRSAGGGPRCSAPALVRGDEDEASFTDAPGMPFELVFGNVAGAHDGQDPHPLGRRVHRAPGAARPRCHPVARAGRRHRLARAGRPEGTVLRVRAPGLGRGGPSRVAP